MSVGGGPLLATQDDTLGPFYPPALVANGTLELVRRPPATDDQGRAPAPRPKGTPIELRVRVLDVDGAPATGALLEVWQANARGVYRVPGSEPQLADDPYFEGYGRVYAADGCFAVTTVMPGAEPGTARAPCVTLTLFSDGIARIVTQVFFPDDPRHATDPVLAGLPPALRERLVARRVGDGVYAIDIHMRGARETPFFEDGTPAAVDR